MRPIRSVHRKSGDTYVRNVDVLWSKFFIQALAQASLGEFRGREDAGGRIAPQSGGGTRED